MLTSDIESIRFEKDNEGAGGIRLRIGQPCLRCHQVESSKCFRISNRHTSTYWRTKNKWNNEHLHQTDKSLTDNIKHAFDYDIITDMSGRNEIMKSDSEKSIQKQSCKN